MYSWETADRGVGWVCDNYKLYVQFVNVPVLPTLGLSKGSMTLAITDERVVVFLPLDFFGDS
jgi:hypothetical protein